MSDLVLVIGGAGFIGSHTVDRLLEQGYAVRILDSLEPRVHPNGRPEWIPADAEFVHGDMRNRETLSGALAGVDVVCHVAALQDYFPTFSAYYDVNVTATALLYELIRSGDHPVRKVVIASSQFVQGEGLYRDREGVLHTPSFRSRRQLEAGEWEHRDADGTLLQWMPTPEEYRSPTNAYSLSKGAQEECALVLGRRYEIPTTVLRYSIVQGARQSHHNAYSGVCRIFTLSYLAGRPPTIFEDGRQVRDFVNVHDVVEANLLALRNGPADDRVFCVGGGEPMTIGEFDRIVAAATGRQELEPEMPGVFRFGDTRHAVSDTGALRSLGWRPQRSPAASVREYLAWVRTEEIAAGRLTQIGEELGRADVLGRVTGR